MSEEDLNNLYEELSHTEIEMKFSLSTNTIKYIQRAIFGNKIVDIGCGSGELLLYLNKKNLYNLTGCDIVLHENIVQNSNINSIKGSITNLPFEDNSFDTVITTHTLEHVMEINKSISELRRIAKNKLIVVVPREHPYLYTPDLHIHFFPYEFSLRAVFGFYNNSSCRLIEGDWVYIEEF